MSGKVKITKFELYITHDENIPQYKVGDTVSSALDSIRGITVLYPANYILIEVEDKE